jgi:type II secretory pathway component PulJ
VRRPQTGSRIPLRPGWTLIELLVVTSLTLLIAGSATVLMSKMMRASHVQASTLVRQRTLHLWETQFRQDGRLAQSAQVIAAPPDQIRVEFQQPGGSVTYQVISGSLERRVNGELGGRWECGSGEWSFTLLEGDRIVRAELRLAEDLSLSGKLPQRSPPVPQWTRMRVDVAIGSKPKGGK